MAAGTARIGFEIEFTGVAAPAAAEAVRAALGGEVHRAGAHVATVEGTGLGPLRFELDTRFREPAKDPDFIDTALEQMELREVAADVLASVVPVELITGPLSRDRFDDLDRVIAALRDAGASGTHDHVLSAFGLHLNVELDPLDADRAIRIAAAFAFVEPWLRSVMGVDLSRRVTPFIDPYPSDYALYLAERYAERDPPSMRKFIAVYGHWNPTRNRALDMWPLLGQFDRAAADAALGEPVKNARPAFHYRLPDSRLSRPGWSPRVEVARWDAIEAIADDEAAFARARDACLDFLTWRIMRAGYDAEIGELMA